jgi:hypothetical protein
MQVQHDRLVLVVLVLLLTCLAAAVVKVVPGTSISSAGVQQVKAPVTPGLQQAGGQEQQAG